MMDKLKRWYMIGIIKITGVVCFGIGGAGMSGHLYKIPRLYDWLGNSVGMSFSSSAAALFVGIGLILIGSMFSHYEKNSGKV